LFVSSKTNYWNSFSSFSHVWQQYGKLVNENLIPVKTENATLTEKNVFLLIRKGKHFPFLSLHTFFSNSQITVSLFSLTIGKQEQVHHFSRTIEALKSRSLSNHFRYLFSFIISFMFLFSSPLCFYLLSLDL